MQAATPTPRRPRERLASLRDPKGSRINRRPARSGPRGICPECQSTQIEDLDGIQVCGACGTTLNESNIVAEVTFGESAAGAAVVQGGFVGEGSRHARTMGPAFRRAGGGMESREVTESFGRDEIRRQANNLHLSDNIADQAFSIYKLAANGNFIQGRRINVVASVCLYVACRRSKDNQTLLMDFSEAISVNVFKLGQTYQDLKKALVLPDNDPLNIKQVDVENLILKFARKLEFGSSLYKVAEDAARIVKRMKRDWMVTGRRPAGLCGACIILAARMNNFRRTVREVVYVVKVADMTVSKRLEEFKRTAAGDLTVDQFREYGGRLKLQADPPALYEQKVREEKKKRSLERMLRGDSQDGGGSRSGSHSSSSQPSQRTEPRLDADGFAIPNLPHDLEILNDASNHVDGSCPNESATEEPAKNKRKREIKLKATRKPPIEISEDDLLVEEELEDEMEDILNDPVSIQTMEEAAFGESEARAKALADSLRNPSARPVAPVSNDPEIGKEEFEDDPEVRNCLLSETEQKIKERIWVTHNEDWLRAQQAKILKKALDEAYGTGPKPKTKRKKSRMGDGSLLEGGTPVEDAAEATQRMLEKRANRFSKHINYEKLNNFYAGLRGTSSGKATTATSMTESEAGAREGSVDAVGGVEERGRSDTPDLTGMSPPRRVETEKKAVGQEEKLEEGVEAEVEEENWDEEEEDEDEDEVEEDVEHALDEFGVVLGGEEDYEGEEI